MVRIFEKGTCWGLSIDAGTGIPMTVNEVAQNIIKYINSKSRITGINETDRRNSRNFTTKSAIRFPSLAVQV